MAKATMATIKSFVRKNQGRLYIREASSFDPMTDCVQSVPWCERKFQSAEPGKHPDNDLGVSGAWFVKGSRDYFTPISEDGFTGFHVYNCCGSFDLAVRS